MLQEDKSKKPQCPHCGSIRIKEIENDRVKCKNPSCGMITVNK
jgi:ribosomal protein L37AE/L43A